MRPSEKVDKAQQQAKRVRLQVIEVGHTAGPKAPVHDGEHRGVDAVVAGHTRGPVSGARPMQGDPLSGVGSSRDAGEVDRGILRTETHVEVRR